MLARIFSWIRAVLPLAAVGIFAGTLWKCLAVMRDGSHFAKWGLREGELPVISMLGVDEPEHSIFAHGFTVLAVVVLVMLVLRNHQLAQEPALYDHGPTRRIALVIGVLALVALLVMAWIPGDQDWHFVAALATFALLSTYAAIHTGLCVALRRSPRTRPWPNLVLLGWMVVTPAASIVCVVLWIVQQEALPQYGAVAMQFAYFLALVPAFLKREPTSAPPTADDASSKYGASIVAVLAALWLAVLVVPAKIAEFGRPLPCNSPTSCFSTASDFEECTRNAVQKDYVVARQYSTMTSYCPRVRTAKGLDSPLAKKLTTVATPFLFFFGFIGFALAFFEPQKEVAVSKHRRVLVRIGLALVMLATPVASKALLGKSRLLESVESIPIFALAFVLLVVAWARIDRLLRGEAMRGFAAPLVLAYGVVAVGIARGLAVCLDIRNISIHEWQDMWLGPRLRLLAEQSHDALEPMQLGLIIVVLPLCLLCVASALREPRADSREKNRVFIALGLAAVGHLVSIGAFEGVDILRFLALVPLATIAIASWRQRRIGRMTHLVLLSCLVAANMATILGHALPWLDELTSEDALELRGDIVGHHAALRFAWLRFAIDLIAYGVTLLGSRARHQDESKPALFVALGAGTVTAAYAACLFFAQEAPYGAVLRGLDAYRNAVAHLPETSVDGDAPIAPTYFISADGSVRFVEPDEVVLSSEPDFFCVAADRAATIGMLGQTQKQSSNFRLLLRGPTADATPSPPERGALGFRRDGTVPHLSSISIGWMISEDRWDWSGAWEMPNTTYASVDATLFELHRPEHRMRIDGSLDGLRAFLCDASYGKRSRTLVLPVSDQETIGELVTRIARHDSLGETFCGFQRIILTRDPEALRRKL